MVKKSTSDKDFISQLRNRSGNNPSDGVNEAAPTAKAFMKLNQPPIGPRISTDELYANEEKKAPTGEAPNANIDSYVNTLSGADAVCKIPINLIEDSPYQPRLIYDPIGLDALGESLNASGQVEAITVRKKGDRYELLGGHRRTRAARNIGWSEIEARIVDCDEKQAEKIALLQNEARVDLSEYERAKVYQRAQERGFANTQTEIAKMFGCNQSTVSNCLKLLSLPQEIRDKLEEKPSLFGSKTGKVMLELLSEHPTELPLIMEFIGRLEHEAEAGTLKQWFMGKIAGRGRRKKDRAIVTGKNGKTLFSTTAANGKIQITLGAGLSVDEDTVQRWILAALRERADQVEAE